MLVLTRREGESIVIGEKIIVTVVKIKDGGKGVRIGIDAPQDVSVYRPEVLERIKEEGCLK